MTTPQIRRAGRPAYAGERIRVVVAHRDPAIRRAVRDSLSGDADVVVAADARSAVEALELARHYRPEAVLVEIALPGRDGAAALVEIARAGDWATLALARPGDDHDAALAALRGGADGVVADLGALASAIRTVRAGGAALAPALAKRLLIQLRSGERTQGLRPVKSALTTREWEVLDLLSAGAGTRAIAAELHLQESTVYGHVKSVLRKLGVRTRADAVTAAFALRRAD